MPFYEGINFSEGALVPAGADIRSSKKKRKRNEYGSPARRSHSDIVAGKAKEYHSINHLTGFPD
jgi:hypothetical protein